MHLGMPWQEASVHCPRLLLLYVSQCPAACVGGGNKGDDDAALLHTAWGEVRSSVQRGGLDAFRFRQYLFACMARLLMQLQRPIEVCAPAVGMAGPERAVIEQALSGTGRLVLSMIKQLQPDSQLGQ